MAERYEVVIRIVSQKGDCPQKHKVGEKWIVSKKTPEGICMTAFHTLFPELRVLMFSGRLPWTADPDVCQVACPDAKNTVVFELRRLRK